MCGICGMVDVRGGAPADAGLLKRMRDVMAYRGPDDEGFLIDGEAALGMRRLSIIDVAGGRQPISNEDGTVSAVCNGEIYNFRELRAALESRGHRFSTKTDVETIVHLYEDQGETAIRRLGGMFAFALWDKKARRLLLGRDRMGKKPLFYARLGGRLIFGSTMKSILLDPAVARDIDLESIHHYLTYQYVPEPATIFSSIRTLPPAHFLVWEDGKIRVERYWDLSFAGKPEMSEADAAEKVYAAVLEATRVRLASEVPLGAFLSGGLDSTVVVGMMSGLASKPVKTFSIGFEEPRFDELAFARLAARHFGTEHHEFTVKPDAVGILPALVWHFEEPMADSSGIPTYYLAEMARRHVTVALTGDGGDEAFAGYERYLAFMLSRYYRWIPAAVREKAILPLLEKLPESARRRSFTRRLKRFARAAAAPGADRYARWMTVFDPELKNGLYTDEMRRKVGGFDSLDYLRAAFRAGDAESDLDRLLYADTVTYLPCDLLVKLDRMSMAHALEARSPFLDQAVMELAAGLPAKLKLKGSTSKAILKKAVAGRLPEEILRRGKQGFGVPIESWFRRELKDWTSGLLLEARTRDRGYFDTGRVRTLLDEHRSGRADHSHRIWALLVLEIWHRTFVDRADITAPVEWDAGGAAGAAPKF